MESLGTLRDERFRAAIDLASGSPASFRRTARRFSICREDAEDAYQRGLEILLTKAPTDDRSQLRPWLHTVIKHEALALRRQRERLLGPEPDEVATQPGPDEHAPERERARRTTEALGGLKRSEAQCMLLKALGYSYDEIADRTGYSWTKVNRSLSEGRRSFFDRFDEISSGESCDRYGATLEVAARGEVSAEQRRDLEVHLRGCSGCRAALRMHRSAPVDLRAVSPVALLGAVRGSWWERAYDSATGAASAKVGQLLELVAGHKVAAVAASTAALAGGVAVEHQAVHRHRPNTEMAAGHTSERRPLTQSPEPVSEQPQTGQSQEQPDSRAEHSASHQDTPQQPASEQSAAPASEFEPAPQQTYSTEPARPTGPSQAAKTKTHTETEFTP